MIMMALSDDDEVCSARLSLGNQIEFQIVRTIHINIK